VIVAAIILPDGMQRPVRWGIHLQTDNRNEDGVRLRWSNGVNN